jgi:colanic acid/amylovoran biosynthesis glycosyltransferase
VWLPVYKYVFSASALLMPVSEYWRTRLIEIGANADKLLVHRMGVITVESGEAIEHTRIHKPLRILTVARATEKKGAKYALAAVARLDVDCEYRLVGDGELLDSLKKLAATLGLEGTTHFLGSQPFEKVMEYLSWADVFLLPSVTAGNGDMEGVPVSLMEAMDRGVIVVSTFHSGIPELIESEVSGFLVPERDSAGIANVLTTIANDEPSVSIVRQEAKNTIESRYSNALLCRQLKLHFQDLCARPF